MLDKFGADYIMAVSDSEQVPTDYQIPIAVWPFDEKCVPLVKDKLNIITFKEPLPARIDRLTYPRYYRSLWGAIKIAKMLQADRLLEIESDAWVYTQRLATKLASIETGIGSPWCPRYRMPEVMLAAYYHDSFDATLRLIESRTWAQWSEPRLASFEQIVSANLPLVVWDEFKGDRYVECGIPVCESSDFSVQDTIPALKWKQ
jgi:hypothetical protein